MLGGGTGKIRRPGIRRHDLKYEASAVRRWRSLFGAITRHDDLPRRRRAQSSGIREVNPCFLLPRPAPAPATGVDTGRSKPSAPARTGNPFCANTNVLSD